MTSAAVGALVLRSDVCFGMHGMIWWFQKVLKGDDNSINFKHLSLELMFRCIFYWKKTSQDPKLSTRNSPQKSTKKFKSLMFHLEGSSIGRRWSRHGTMLHQLSQRVRGAQFLCDGKIRAFHDIFRPNLCCGITFKQNNALKDFCWLSKSVWAYVMSWLLWVYNMQLLRSCQVGCFSLCVTLFKKIIYICICRW